MFFYLFSVMEKLPATSYVRLVDIWLIFGQLMPFIQVSTVCVVFMLLGIKFTKYTIRSIVCEASCHSVTRSLGHSVTRSLGHLVTQS